jgi:acetyltransferase-like isoleucine patch superfamily enzyme
VTSGVYPRNVERRFNRRAVRYELVPPPMRVSIDAIEKCRREVESALKAAIRTKLLPLIKYRLGAAEIGEGFHWGRNIDVTDVRIGRFVSVLHGSDIAGPVCVGDLAMLSSGIKLVGTDHDAIDPSRILRIAFPTSPRPVTVIEADCLIGHGAILFEGVRIGRGTVVGAGSVVTKDTEPYSIVAGSPARTIRTRFSIEDQKRYDAFLYD